MRFPSNFKSYEEYSTYMHCLSKAKAGDEVEAYFASYENKELFSPSNIPTDIVKKAIVVGVDGSNGLSYYVKGSLLLGTYDCNIGFWEMTGVIKKYNEKTGTPAFPYYFWAYATDIRIKRINKK